MLWMATPTQDFHLVVLNILAFSGITLSMTFGVALDLYRRCKYVAYGEYGSPIGNHVITSRSKLPYIFFFYFFLKSWNKTALVLTPTMEFRS